MLALELHASPNGYALAFVGGGRHETVAHFPTLAAAARALRAAQAALADIAGLQTYNYPPSLHP